MTELKRFSNPQTEEEIRDEKIRSSINRPYYNYRVYLADVDDHDGGEMAKVISQQRYIDLELEEEYRLEAGEEDKRLAEAEVGKSDESGKEKKDGKKRGSLKRKSLKRKSMKRGSVKRGSMKSGSSKRGSMKRGSVKKRGSMKSGPTGAKRPSKGGRKSIKVQASLKRGSKRGSVRAQSLKSAGKARGKKKKGKMEQLDGEIEEIDLDSIWPRHLLYRPGYTKEYEIPKDYTNLWIDEGKEKAMRYPDLRLKHDHRGVLERFWQYVENFQRITKAPAPPAGPIYELPDIKPNVAKVVREFRKELKQMEKSKEELAYYDKNLIQKKPFYEVFATHGAKNSSLVRKLVNVPTETALDFEDLYSCMTFIFDVHAKSDVIEPAKALLEKLVNRLTSIPTEKRLKLQSYFGIHSFVAISTLLTWAGTKIPHGEIREEYFPRRVPHPRYKKQYDFENFLYDMAFRYRDVIKIIIIGVGVVYGSGEGVLRQYFTNEFKNIPIFQPGNNKVQMIHIEDLARLCLHVTKNWPEYTRYIVAAETRVYHQEEVVKAIASVMPYSTAVSAPKCYGKAFGFSDDRLNIMKANINVFPTYLHKIIKYPFKYSFLNHVGESFTTYRKIIGRIPLRILLYGPTTRLQKQIGLTLAKYYNIGYFSPFQVVKLFLRLLQRMQDIVLTNAAFKPPNEIPSTGLVDQPKTSNFSWDKIQENSNQFFRTLLRRNVTSMELRSPVDSKSLPLKYEDMLFPNSDIKDKLVSQIGLSDNPQSEVRSILIKFAELRASRSILTSMIKREVQAVIMNELLQCPSVKNDGYVLDGFPTTEKECDVVFCDSTNPTDVPNRNRIDTYKNIPQWVFSILIDTETALRSNLDSNTDLDFQNDPMNFFRGVQTHKLATLRAVTSVDIFENIFGVPHCEFSLQHDTPENITAQIIQMISGEVNKAWLNECTLKIQNRLKPKREPKEVKLSQFPQPKKFFRYDSTYFNYLTKMLSKHCVRALVDLPKVKPEDVNGWISRTFLENNNDARMPYKFLGVKTGEEPEPDGKYPYGEKNRDFNFIKHLD